MNRGLHVVGAQLVEQVERAAHAGHALLHDVRVDHGRGHVLVAQKLLHGADVVALSSKWVAKLCRKVWALMCLVKPAWRTAAAMARWSGPSCTWWRPTLPLRGSRDSCREASRNCQPSSRGALGYLR